MRPAVVSWQSQLSQGADHRSKNADAVLSIGPHSEEPLPISRSVASAGETVRLGNIAKAGSASTVANITNAGIGVNGMKWNKSLL